ncbi:MAG: hypothetical protein Tsb002_06850 [Wenzhouxiangellaceae bacterium]
MLHAGCGDGRRDGCPWVTLESLGGNAEEMRSILTGDDALGIIRTLTAGKSAGQQGVVSHQTKGADIRRILACVMISL